MSTAMKVGLIALGLFSLIGIIFGISLIGTYNDCIGQEVGIENQYKQDQNNYANYFDKIKEMAQVPDMATDKLKELYDSTMKGRYGAEGSKAMFQFIKEQNPNFDMSMYKQLEQAIEAGRNSFSADQQTLLDKKRVYEKIYKGITLARFMGFPKQDMSKYDIVINDATAKAFATKRAGPINLKDK